MQAGIQLLISLTSKASLEVLNTFKGIPDTEITFLWSGVSLFLEVKNMKKNITIGGKEMAFEANLGTTRLYEVLTGQNIMQIMLDFTKSADRQREVVKLLDVFEKLAYVMHVQATNDDIKTMKAMMNDDDLLEWLSTLDSFTEAELMEIASLWGQTQQTHSVNDSKNA